MNKRKLLVLALILVVFVAPLSMKLSYAIPLNCELRNSCYSNETCIFSMKKTTNSHIGMCGYYDNQMCCDDYFSMRLVINGTSTTGNKILGTYKQNNSHVSAPDLANYNLIALCGLHCEIKNTCYDNETEIIDLYKNIGGQFKNSHISIPGITSFKLCCYNDGSCSTNIDSINADPIYYKESEGKNYTTSPFTLLANVSDAVGILDNTCEYTINGTWIGMTQTNINSTHATCTAELVGSNDENLSIYVRVQGTDGRVGSNSEPFNITIDSEPPSIGEIFSNDSLVAQQDNLNFTIIDYPSVGLKDAWYSFDGGVNNHTFTTIDNLIHEINLSKTDRGYVWIDVWARDYLNNLRHKKYKYDVGLRARFNITNANMSELNNTRFFILTPNASYTDSSAIKKYGAISGSVKAFDNIFSVNEKVDVFLTVPTQYGLLKARIKGVNITGETIPIRFIKSNEYNGYKPIRSQTSDLLMINPEYMSYDGFDFYIPYNSSTITPQVFLHCQNFDFTNNNCTQWSVERINESAYLSNATEIGKKTIMKCLPFSNYDDFNPESFKMYATSRDDFKHYVFDDFEYKLNNWTGINGVSYETNTSNSKSGDWSLSVQYTDSNQWIEKQLDVNTGEYPYLTFAYNVNSNSKFDLRIITNDNEVLVYNGTSSNGNYSLPNFINDGAWHVVSINLNKDLVNNGLNPFVKKIDFGAIDSVNNTSFFIDDFLISNIKPGGAGNMLYFNDFESLLRVLNDWNQKISNTLSLGIDSNTGFYSMNVSCQDNYCSILKPLHFTVGDYPRIAFSYKIPSTAYTSFMVYVKNNDVLYKFCYDMGAGCGTYKTILASSEVQRDNNWHNVELDLGNSIINAGLNDPFASYVIAFEFANEGAVDSVGQSFLIDTFSVMPGNMGKCIGCDIRVNTTLNSLSDGVKTAYLTMINGVNEDKFIRMPIRAEITSALIDYSSFKNPDSLTPSLIENTLTTTTSVGSIIDLDVKDYIYSLDASNKKIHKYYLNTTFINDINLGSDDGVNPNGFFINDSNWMFVTNINASTSNGNVLVLNPNGVLVNSISGFAHPFDVVEENGRLFVSDDKLNKIFVLWINGTSIFNITGLDIPKYLHVNSSGFLFVSDNGGIKIFNTTYSLIKAIKLESNEYSILHPEAISTDGYGNIFVGDPANNKVQVFRKDGVYLTSINNLNNPYAIAVSSDNKIYVSDSALGSIKIYPSLKATTTFDLGGDGINLFSSDGIQNITLELQTLTNSCNCPNCIQEDNNCLIPLKFSSDGDVKINNINVLFKGEGSNFIVDYIYDFEGGYEGWMNNLTRIRLSPISYDGKFGLEVQSKLGEDKIVAFVNLPSAVDSNDKQFINFAYKVPSDSKFNLLLTVNGSKYFVKGTDSVIPDATYLGDIPDFVADNTWRTASFNLDAMLDEVLGDAIHSIESIGFGKSTDVDTSTLKLFYIDDISLTNKGISDCPYKQENAEYVFSASTLDGGTQAELLPDLNVSSSGITTNVSEPEAGVLTKLNIVVTNHGDDTAHNVNVTCEKNGILVDYNDSLTTLAVGSATVACEFTPSYGNQTIRVNVSTTDDELNLDDNSAEKIIRGYDKTPPQIIIKSPLNDSWYFSPTTLNYTVTDNLDSLLDCKYVLNNTFITNSGSVMNNTEDIEYMNTRGTPQGAYNVVYLNCTDDDGNVGKSEDVYFSVYCTYSTDCEEGTACIKLDVGSKCMTCNSTYLWHLCANATLGSYSLTDTASMCWNDTHNLSCLPTINVTNENNYPRIYQNGSDRTNKYIDINDTFSLNTSLMTKVGFFQPYLKMACYDANCEFSNNQETAIYSSATNVGLIARANQSINNKCGLWRLYNMLNSNPQFYELNGTGLKAGAQNATKANVTVDDLIISPASDFWVQGSSDSVNLNVRTEYCTGNTTRKHTIECYLDCDPENADNSGGCSKIEGSSSVHGNYAVLSGVTNGTHVLTINNIEDADYHTIYCVANDDDFDVLDTDTQILYENFSTSVFVNAKVLTPQPIEEKGDVQIQINASDIVDKNNLRFIELRINSSAGDLFYDNLTTSVGGDCYSLNTTTYVCNINLTKVDAGIYTVYARTVNNALFGALSETLFSVSGLFCSLNVKNNTIQGVEDTAKFTVNRIPSGDVSDFSIFFYKDDELVGESTSDDNGYAEIEYTTPLAGMHNYTVSCNKSELNDTETQWIKTEKTSLFVLPNSQVFGLGDTGMNAYEYIVENPSNGEQEYTLYLSSNKNPVRFSSNGKTTYSIIVPPFNNKTGFIDLIPTRLGQDTIHVYFRNENSELDSAISEDKHILLESEVRAISNNNVFSVQITPGIKNYQVLLLFLFAASIYLQKSFK